MPCWTQLVATHPPQDRAWLGPSAKVVAPRGKLFKERGENKTKQTKTKPKTKKTRTTTTKKHRHRQSEEESVRNSPADTMVRRGTASWWSRDAPAAPGGDQAGSGFSSETSSPWGSHAGAGEEQEEEGAAKGNSYGLTPAPICHPSALLR